MDKGNPEIVRLIRSALDEDIGPGDITSIACLEPGPVKAAVVAKSDGILSGMVPFRLAFETVDSAIEVSPMKQDGDSFTAGDGIAELAGFNVPMLAAERVALNFLAHLSGIATLTGKFVRELEGTECQVLDTRKTTPGWRTLEKAAVAHGGGGNHRMGLYDMILIKDNHIAAAGSIAGAVARARDYLRSPDLQLQFNTRADLVEIEVEVTSESEVLEAIKAGVSRLLLDNQSVDSLRKLVTLARETDSAVKLEASGNVTLETISTIARTGVDFISAGALTHSAPVADFSMRVLSRQP